MKKLLVLPVLLHSLFVGDPAFSADFQKGIDAYKTGDYATAFREFRSLAEQGNGSAQFNLGQMYRNEQGVPQNDKTAVKWYKLAAKQGHALAQTNLGVMYENGIGVPQDDKIAVKWYALAAEQGNTISQSNLEYLQKKIAQLKNNITEPKPLKLVAQKIPTPTSGDYQKGVDAVLRRDFATALKEWKPLAEQGDATPQFQLGWMYKEGHGVTQDYKTAIRWYKLAAEQGYAYAQTALGHMYVNGHGVLQDYTRAYMWFNIAASLWDGDARKWQDIVAKKMDPTQIEEALGLVSVCVKINYKGC